MPQKSLNIKAGESPALPPTVFERRWPSRMDLKQEIMDEVVELLISKGWVAEDDRAWLYLCFDEVVVNAMLHGNEGDPRLEVALSVRVDERQWVVTVADQGDGFSDSVLHQDVQESIAFPP